MQAIKRNTERLGVETLSMATEIAEAFGDGFDFHGCQVGLWSMLSGAEHRLSVLAGRRIRRNKRWKGLKQRVSGQLRAAHLKALRNYEQGLRDRVSVGKQIGDALAWNLARGDHPRYLESLFKASTHQLPTSCAVDAYFRILEAAESSEAYQAVLSDLTRCCGVGDVLILGARWPVPSAFEIKVATQADGTLLTALYGHSVAFQVFREELERFEAAFGSKSPTPRRFDRRGERQKEEVNAGTRTSFSEFTSAHSHAAPAVRRNWKSLEGVLSRAAAGIRACDKPEPGIAYVAMRSRDVNSATLRDIVWETLRYAEVDAEEEHWQMWQSSEYLANDALAVNSLPYLLWRIRPALRALLMTGTVLLITLARKSVWYEAFRRAGVTWREMGDGKWRLTAHGNELLFDTSDVKRLRMGVAFSGISPEAVAKNAARELLMPGRVKVVRYRTSNDEPLEQLVRRDPKGRCISE